MPRKLGQHFLKDKRMLKKIAEALEINSRDTIVEIGPGHGELTKYLLEANPRKLIAIEKDKKLATFLRKNPQLSPEASDRRSQGIEIIEGDILKILPNLYSKIDPPAGGRNFKLCGNIPYYLTGFLFRKISELEYKPKLIVFTIQKEVAERICAKPPKMNLLAASVQFWGKPKIVGYISKKFFRPPPKVDSAIIRIVPHHKQPSQKEAQKYYRFIKILFKQPRKTVLNNLRSGLKLSQEEVEKGLKMLRIPPTARPANLSTADINKLIVIFSYKRV